MTRGTDRLLDELARAAFFAVGPVAYLTPRGMTAMLILLTVAAAAMVLRRGRFDIRALAAAALPWLPFLALLPLSALWSIDPGASLLLCLRVLGLFLCGALLIQGFSALPAASVLRLLRALAWGFMLAALGVIVEVFDGQEFLRLTGSARGEDILLSHYSRGSDFAAFLIPALALGLWRNGARKLAVAQLIVGGIAILIGWELSAKLALVVGVLAGTLILAAPRLRWALVAALALAAVAGPLIVPVTLSADETCWLAAHKPSGLHRVMIWNFVGGKIRERPWLGYGLDSARALPGGHTPIQIRACGAQPDAPFVIDNQLLPLHPHNAVLQIWLELGALGALLGFGALLISLSRALAAPRLAGRAPQAMVTALAAAAIGPGFLSFGVWQEWWVASLFVGIAAVLALAKHLGESPADMLEQRSPD
jgi:exopolysaccharide production protein ExoQ